MHFNLERASIACAAALFVVFTIQLFLLDALPTWMVLDQAHVADFTYCRGGMLCEVCAPLVFLPVLMWGHHLGGKQTFFLDIACISQDDQRLKQKGISSLGAILDRSERMIVLCDGQYFSRLWCLFELSAFAKRAGVERVDLIPLHAPLRVFGWVLSFALFYLAMTTLMWPVVGDWLTQLLYSSYLYIPLYTSAWMMLGVPVILAAEVEAREIRTALAALRHFRLTDASCFSESDRHAILSLVGKWWSDTSSGETDPERLRQLGFHRFERFVRHSLAPQLSGRASSDWTPTSFFALFVVGSLGWILDLLTYTDATVHHTSAYVCYAAFCYGVWVPMLIQAVKTVATGVWLGKRRGWPALPLYAVALSACVAAIVLSSLVMYYVPFPNVVLQPDWRWPRDESVGALDAFGIKVQKFQMVLAAYSIAAGRYYSR